jgi:hypothetical protein
MMLRDSGKLDISLQSVILSILFSTVLFPTSRHEPRVQLKLKPENDTQRLKAHFLHTTGATGIINSFERQKSRNQFSSIYFAAMSFEFQIVLPE